MGNNPLLLGKFHRRTMFGGIGLKSRDSAKYKSRKLGRSGYDELRQILQIV